MSPTLCTDFILPARPSCMSLSASNYHFKCLCNERSCLELHQIPVRELMVIIGAWFVYSMPNRKYQINVSAID